MIVRYACVGLVAQWGLLAALAAATPDREAMRDASDAELKAQLTAAMPKVAGWDREAVPARDGVLLEIARRGGDEWAAFLRDELKRPEPEDAEPAHNKPEGASLELLTTLRRIQRRADPVQIRLGIDASKPLTYEFPALPQVPVALANQDADELAVRFTEGGDYRTGRQARWRFEVRDAAGKLMPVRERIGDFGGGLYHEGALAFGETWSTDLDMSAFIAALPPGHYHVRIRYHDSLCISEMGDADVAALVTCKSEEFNLVVVPRVVTVSNAQDREVRGLLDQIPLDGPVRIVAGTYGHWAEKLVPPDSAQGRLLKYELQAVPPLLRALEDEKLPAKRRAVILGLLYSLTGQNDPQDEDGAIGDSRSVLGPWKVWGGGGGGVFLGGSASRGGTIDEAKQRAFAERWSSWKDYFRVARPPEDVD